jgi:hypothetical protein
LISRYSRNDQHLAASGEKSMSYLGEIIGQYSNFAASIGDAYVTLPQSKATV